MPMLRLSCFILSLFLLSCEMKKENLEIKRIKKEVEIINSYNIPNPWKRFQADTFGTGFLAYDYYNKSIVKLDSEFNLISKLSSEGDAPNENRMILNFQQLDSEWVAIFDTENNTFKIQNWNDSVKTFFRFPERFERGVLINDSIIIYSLFSETDVRLRFATRNINNSFEFHELTQLNELIDEPLSGFIYEGVIGYSKQYFYNFSGLYSDFIRLNLTTWEGEKLNYGVDKEFQKPQVFKIAGGYYAGNNPEIVPHATVYRNEIYILSNITNSDFGNSRIIDVYRERDFKYLHSYSLANLPNFAPREIFFSSNYTYLFHDNIVYKIKLK